MESKQPIASEKEAAATVLPKRKASEPFLIPWQDERPFKLSKEYILQFYEGKGQQIMYTYWIPGGILPQKPRPLIVATVSVRISMSTPTNWCVAMASKRRS